MFYVYKVTNVVNGRIYIGKTSNIDRRWQEHTTHPFNSKTENECPYLYAAIRKYGISNFQLEIIESFESEEDSLFKEEEYIKEYNSQILGYNISSGGQGFKSADKHPQFGKPIKQDVKIKISESLKGRRISADVKKKTSQSLIGRFSGEENSQSKISNEDALKIKELYSTGKFTQAKLAEFFNVKRTTISYILNVRLK